MAYHRATRSKRRLSLKIYSAYQGHRSGVYVQLWASIYVILNCAFCTSWTVANGPGDACFFQSCTHLNHKWWGRSVLGGQKWTSAPWPMAVFFESYNNLLVVVSFDSRDVPLNKYDGASKEPCFAMHGRRYCVIEETKEMFHVSIKCRT